jgi:hypothetical protein
MNLDATEADLHAANECLKLAAILDDRAPKADKARIAAWAEKIHTHHLERGDLLDGLQAFYDSPSERAIQIGDLIGHARAARRSRVMREETADREARQERNDEKAASDFRALTADVLSGRTKDTPRLKTARAALDDCRDKASAQAAIAEYVAAKREAGGKPKASAR